MVRVYMHVHAQHTILYAYYIVYMQFLFHHNRSCVHQSREKQSLRILYKRSSFLRQSWRSSTATHKFNTQLHSHQYKYVHVHTGLQATCIYRYMYMYMTCMYMYIQVYKNKNIYIEMLKDLGMAVLALGKYLPYSRCIADIHSWPWPWFIFVRYTPAVRNIGLRDTP